MDTETLVLWLAQKLNEEMKNIVKKELTNRLHDDIINVSNEREDNKIE